MVTPFFMLTAIEVSQTFGFTVEMIIKTALTLPVFFDSVGGGGTDLFEQYLKLEKTINFVDLLSLSSKDCFGFLSDDSPSETPVVSLCVSSSLCDLMILRFSHLVSKVILSSTNSFLCLRLSFFTLRLDPAGLLSFFRFFSLLLENISIFLSLNLQQVTVH